MMSTHHPRSRQGTRDQVRTKPLNAQIPLRPKERTENAVRVVLGFLLQSFHLFLGCHYIFTVASPPSSPTPPPPGLSTALPHTRLGSQNCLPSVPLERRAQFPWRGARILSDEGCLSSRMCSLGWSYQAPLPIYSLIL